MEVIPMPPGLMPGVAKEGPSSWRQYAPGRFDEMVSPAILE